MVGEEKIKAIRSKLIILIIILIVMTCYMNFENYLCLLLKSLHFLVISSKPVDQLMSVEYCQQCHGNSEGER